MKAFIQIEISSQKSLIWNMNIYILKYFSVKRFKGFCFPVKQISKYLPTSNVHNVLSFSRTL